MCRGRLHHFVKMAHSESNSFWNGRFNVPLRCPKPLFPKFDNLFPLFYCVIKISPAGTVLVAATADGTIKLWDPVTGTCIRNLQQTTGQGKIENVSDSHDDKILVTSSVSYGIHIWGLTAGKFKRTSGCPEDNLMSVAISPDGKTSASGTFENTINLWDTATGAWKQTIQSEILVMDLSFSDDGRYLRQDRGPSC